MPICTQCTYPVAYLYTLYQSVNNLRLEQCPNCLAFADPYVEHDPLTLLLDLILLKREVYRHLLFNRGHEPRHLGKPGASDTKPGEGKNSAATKGTWKLVIELASMLILIDAFIRWRGSTRTPSAPSFGRVAMTCALDTAIFHTSVTLACVLLLRTKSWYGVAFGCLDSPKLGTRAGFQIPLVSLTLLYSSLTKLFLLLLLAIWQSPPSFTAPSSADIGAGLPDNLVQLPLIQHMLVLLDEDHFDRAWVVRNVLGGMSAGFGLRVLLDCHPILTTLVVLFGWSAKSVVAQSIAVQLGLGETLEYSIP
ncbi:Arv1-domain-containing protein [Ceratobasidium sp. AG-I]|nr:Arv1-domain-containing protein [Ceratobasidium sp. AG-I]